MSPFPQSAGLLEELAKKYKRETKLEPTMLRLRRAQAFCKKHGFTCKDFRFENHYDKKWNKLKPRTDLERLSASIGRTNARLTGHSYSHWWAVPKRAPRS